MKELIEYNRLGGRSLGKMIILIQVEVIMIATTNTGKGTTHER